MGLQESDMLERLTFSLFFFLFTVHSTTDTLLVYVSKGFFGCSLKKRVLELQRWKQPVPQTKDGDGSVSGDGSRVTEKSYPGHVLEDKVNTVC